MIEFQNVSRDFKSLKRQPGLKGFAKNIIYPEYKYKTAVDSVSFEIPQGSFIGLIGPNGAGKTTILKILSGLIPATAGLVKVAGEDPFLRSLGFRKAIGLVMGQKAQLWWDLPARDAFELIAAIYEIPPFEYRSRVQELTQLLRIEKLLDVQIRRLSLGERMKMELVGAILHHPKILFLDEPTIGLDVLSAQALRDFLIAWNRDKKVTVLLTSHNMDDIERLCSRILVLREGKIIYNGSPNGIGDSSIREVQFQFRQLISAAELRSNGLKVEGDGEFLEIKNTLGKDDLPEVISRVLRSLPVSDLKIESESLEDVIHKVFR